MTDEELIEIASSFRSGLLDDRSSRLMCAAVSWPLAGLLSALYQVSCRCEESVVGDLNHVWIRLSDGRVLDPTADQFGEQYPAIYLGEENELHREKA